MLTPAPLFISNVFNDQAWQFTNYLTTTQASVLFVGTSLLPSTPGIAQAGKLMQTDLSNSITSLNSFGVTTITQLGQYSNTSTTDASSLITGSMITAGGLGVAKSIFCSAQSIVNGTSQITLNSSSNSAGRSTVAFQNDSTTFEVGLRGTTNGTYNNMLYMYASGSYLMTMNILGWTSFLATQDATSSTIGGAMTISGGCGIAKKLYVGSHTSVSGSILQGTSTDTTRAISALNSGLAISGNQYICFGQGTTNNNQAEMSFVYSGAGSTLNRIDFGFYGSNRWFQIQATSDCSFNGTNDATSSTYGGALTSLGGFSCAKKLYCGSIANIATSATIGSSSNTGGTLSITSVGYHITNYYSGTVYSSINTSSGGDIVLTSVNGGTNTYYTFGNNGQIQLSGITARNGHKMDLGTNAGKDNILCLAQTNNTSPSYMLGVNNSTLQYVSGSAHAWYANVSSTPAVNGTQNMSLTQQGSLILNNSGFHTYGSDITSLSSINAQGLHMQVASNVGTILNYNYNTSTYGDININSTLFIKSSNSSVGIGTNSPSCPLEVNGTNTQSTASGFGFLNSGGAGSATGFTNRAFSIKTSGGIMVSSGEIDVLSDERLKQDIIPISEDTSERFVLDIIPIEYGYKCNPEIKHYGYSAQQLVKHNYNDIVGYTSADSPLPEQTIECANGDLLSLSSDTRLVVNLLHTIPLLHKALQSALHKIDDLTQVCGKQQLQIDQLLDAKLTRKSKKK